MSSEKAKIGQIEALGIPDAAALLAEHGDVERAVAAYFDPKPQVKSTSSLSKTKQSSLMVKKRDRDVFVLDESSNDESPCRPPLARVV